MSWWVTHRKIFFVLALSGCLGACTRRVGLGVFDNCKLTVPASTGHPKMGGFPRDPDRIPSTGTAKVTVLMVDFSDAAASKTPAEAYAMVSDASALFTEQSYGRLSYTMTPHSQWLRMSKSSDNYSFNLDFFSEAIELADSAVDFSDTDLVVVLQNPDAQEINPIGPTLTRSEGEGITADGREILNFISSGKDLNDWGSIWLNHESTHALGLVDLYAQDRATDTLFGALPYTGGFSYMGYNSFDSNAPGLTAWERWVLGWIDDSQVLCSNPRADGTIEELVTPIESSGGLKAVMIPVSDTKIVVVESRRAQGIDENIQKTGALVYTVDTSVATGDGPIRVFPRGSESDPLFAASPRGDGESVSAGGIHVEVISSSSSGDTVRITPTKFWIEK